jgi:hypothetical protein
VGLFSKKAFAKRVAIDSNGHTRGRNEDDRPAALRVRAERLVRALASRSRRAEPSVPTPPRLASRAARHRRREAAQGKDTTALAGVEGVAPRRRVADPRDAAAFLWCGVLHCSPERRIQPK